MSTVAFDLTQFLELTTDLDLDGITSDKFLLSMDFTPTDVGVSTRTILRNRKTAAGEVQVVQLTTGALRIIIKNPAAAEIARITTSALTQGTRYAILVSIDTNAGNLVGTSFVNDVASGVDVPTAGLIEYDGAPWNIMRNGTIVNTRMACEISQLRVWSNVAPDLTVEANRRFFFDAGNNPAAINDAVSEFGQPVISYTGSAVDWNAGTNEGFGNDFTMIGTVVNVGASVDDVNSDEIVMDASLANTMTVSGFGVDVTEIKFKSGSFETPALSQSGTGTSYTFDAGDQTANVGDTAGCPMTSPSWAVAVQAFDGTLTGEIAVSRTPKAGWSVVEIVDGQSVTGLFVTRPGGAPADISQVLHDNTATILSDGNYTVQSETSAIIPFQLFVADTGIWENWLINVNQIKISDTLSSTDPITLVTPILNTVFDCYCTKVDDQTTVYVQATSDGSGVIVLNDAGLVAGTWNVAFREVGGAVRKAIQDYTVI